MKSIINSFYIDSVYFYNLIITERKNNYHYRSTRRHVVSHGFTGTCPCYPQYLSPLCFKSWTKDDGIKATFPTQQYTNTLQCYSSFIQHLASVLGKMTFV